MRPPLYYRLAITALKPLYRLFLARKKANLPHYEREIAERFGQGYVPISHDKPVVWCHAVSLGELNTVYPLLRRMLSDGYHLWITSTTQTGFNRAKVLFENKLGKSVQHSFVPVDDVAVLGQFLAHVRPLMAVFVETELWANTLSVLANQGIPSVMANARLTQKSFDSYAKFARLSQSMMANLSLIIAQDEQSYHNFIALGASSDKVKQAYSLKWSGQIGKTQALADFNNFAKNRPIWVMASTHDGEEQLALDTHKRLLADFPNLLLILVPRHPERFDEVASLCTEFVYHRRSQGEPIADSTQVYLADSMGELLGWYELSDVAVVGGSFVDKGGHNPIEPVSLATPVIMGQYVKNCAEIVRDFADVGVLIQSDDDGLYDNIKAWLDNPALAKQAGESGQRLVQERAGADKVQFDMIRKLL
ncbi:MULTISPECIES: 3-deoxy-D-manno-octulosonic acid transferase [unclassified Moraxella]|uniref:3-deoxy-D-manno-octulosonic acid transferase n=1 Tax=unclassified Moraxella TaxID=2685852 RepID=UPI00187F0837|nr:MULTISPECIES: 3-deoxy-D-manno-octulosonic acid transferase [unclassified Moraxella]MBE9588375.1 3-deoxy-D-manno-octulosonic acid transferase [Moraxella sp. K1630]MBE9596432.1 3-deoxy-D-manno-octulosonic acid transferase [Moraxella sp. K2450]